jgi:serine/threonine-protein kinase
MRLSHPNVLRVFEVAEAEDGSPYLVMERLEGAPLSAYMRPGQSIPTANAVAILQGILAALGAAHAQGIVHRDLKPENVFVLRDAPGPTIKLLDFGIAKVMDAAGGMGSRTRTGMLLGTPAYMSPEQARSGRDADARSDLWSAGVILYELLAGRQAFVAPNEFARLTLIMTAEPEPLPAAASAFAPFVARALKKDRAERFQSAQEMSLALASVPVDGSSQAAAMPAPVSQSPATAPTLSSQEAARNATLNSGEAAPIPSSRPPPVVMIPPSQPAPPYSFSNAKPRGISQVAVVLLVTFALMAGFILGFAVARSM